MTILEQDLQTILNEKTTKIIPENMKEWDTRLGVTGTYTGEENSSGE